MDEFPEDDQPMYIPARRSFEVVHYPAARRRPSFLVLFFVILSALLAFWLVTDWIREYRHSHDLHRLEKAMPSMFPVLPTEHVQDIPLSAPSGPSPAVGPYHLPLSTVYRLQGLVRSVGISDYLATSLQGAYILIPAKNCQLVNGGPYCRYHGTTVTGTSGNH